MSKHGFLEEIVVFHILVSLTKIYEVVYSQILNSRAVETDKSIYGELIHSHWGPKSFHFKAKFVGSIFFLFCLLVFSSCSFPLSLTPTVAIVQL